MSVPDPSPEPDPRRWLALGILLTGAFLAPLDFFIVNVALPSMSADLRASEDQIQLVISAYAVVYAVFLITGGRLGDLYGRKRVFLAGLAGFALASALCGLAPDPRWLIAGRVAQALAAAAMAPQALASIHALFPERERGRALGIFSFVLGLSSVAGQLLGGALVQADLDGLGWRLVFLINLPIAIGAFATAIPLLPDSRSPNRPRLDLGGVVFSALALAAFIVPLIEGRERGWPWWSVALLAASPVLAVMFGRHELRLARRGGDPLVALDAFRAPGLLRGLGAILTIYAMAAFFLTFAIYEQAGLGRSAWQSGLAILPLSIGFLLASVLSASLSRRLGAAAPALGFLLSVFGLVATAVVVDRGGAEALLTPTLFVLGFGVGTTIPTMVRAVAERVEAHRAGLVGGVVNSTLQVSAALGVAVLGGLFFVALGAHRDQAAIAHAFAITLLGVATAHAIGGLLAAGLIPRRARRRVAVAARACEAGAPAVASASHPH